MKHSVTIDGIEFKARGVKFKEIKELIATSKVTINQAFELLNQEDVASAGIDFVLKHCETLEGIITRLTSLTKDEIEEMEILTLIHVLKALLEINGVDSKKVYDFFHNIYKEKVEQIKPVTVAFQEVGQ